MPGTPPEHSADLPPVHPRWARWLATWSLRSLSALLGPITLIVLAGLLWFWTGTEGSLGTALKWVNRALPASQHLLSSDVQGNLRHGGRVGQLQWQAPSLQVRARDAVIVLDWSLLWRQPWPVQSLHLGSLVIDDQRPAKPLTPWQDLHWPLPLQMALKVDHVHWQGATSLTLSGIQAHYAYDGQTHQLEVPTLTMAQGQYALQASLQGAAPMALKLGVHGQIKTPAKNQSDLQTLALEASLQGTLSGPQAQLAAQGQLVPAPAQGAGRPAQKDVHLSFQADFRPWQSPAIVQAQGQWQALNLAPLWPQAPQTHLNGQLQIMPVGADWSLHGQVHNLQPGPWNLQRLPLSHLTLHAHRHQGLWQLRPSLAKLAAGQVQVEGAQSPSGWSASLAITDIQPAQLHTALGAGAIGGRLQAQQNEHGPIRFVTQLQAAATAPSQSKDKTQHRTTPSIALEQLVLDGQWQDQVWQIDSLKLQARQASLEGHFRLAPEQAALQGQLALQLPGLRATGEGRLSPLDGQGGLNIDVHDAALSLAWLNALPVRFERLQALKATGPGQLKARWQGGYAQAHTALALDMQWPRLSWQQAQQSPWVLERSQLQMAGSPLSWQAQWQGHLGQGQTSSRGQARLSATRPGLHSSEWRAQLEQFDLGILGPQAQAAWQVQLQKPMAWQARLERSTLDLAWSSATWEVRGPTPGKSRVEVEPGRWHVSAPAGSPRASLAASWDEMPLSWLPNHWGSSVQNDVMLRGQVQFEQNTDMRLTAKIWRSRGDLRIQADDGSGQLTAAGFRDTSLALRVHNDQLQADVHWDSEHMGQAHAQLHSTLHRSTAGWQWPRQAPLRGTVKAHLPQMGVWSVFAPPGWRVQGTLDARFDLTGTLGQPQWQGQLQARQLAARSAVQGMAFDQGHLQARLQGQKLILDRLSFRGAGPQGGEISAQGQITLGPSATRPTARNGQPLSGVDMVLQMEAKSLRVSQRADRRLVTSGQVTARMQAGQLQLRGQLKADQALFLLPEENTPRLGDDVVVVRRPGQQGRTAAENAHRGVFESWIGVPDVRVMLDLGPDFRLEGKGLNTRLTGQVELVSNASTQSLPRLTGQVRTLGGSYKAYGQQLNISTGILHFNGAYDNPGLEIIALRPHLAQSVGVQVSGTALLPRIRLYANPDMPDGDKLAWLVLGRSAASGGVESAVLQQAAMVLLGGNGKTLGSELAGNLGIDEISLGTSRRSGVHATGAVVTLGKRLSQDFYMAYEASLSGTLGSFYIFYDISRKLTLRAQAAEQSALDLIWTIRKD